MTEDQAKYIVWHSVYNKITEQDSPAIGFENCVYRDGSGNKCAFGHLIPDSLYDPDMEGKAVSLLLNNTNPSFKKLRQYLKDTYGEWAVSHEGENFFEELQGAHDNNTGGNQEEFIDRFQHDMRLLAEAYNIDISRTLLK